MTYGIARPQIKGKHFDHDQLDHLCCAHGCKADALEGAPVPLCGDHMRIAFAHVLMSAERKSAEVIELVEVAEPTKKNNPSVVRKPKRKKIKSRKRISPEGFVYFIQFADRVKIGWSSKPTARLRDLPHDEVLAIIPGTMREERACHAMFAHLRTTGEWFMVAPDLLDFIADLPRSA